MCSHDANLRIGYAKMKDNDLLVSPRWFINSDRLFKYCQVCGEKNPGLLYGGRSCKSCMYFFRRVTFEEISYFCNAKDRKGHCVEQTDCIKCRRSCRSCRFKVLLRSNWMSSCLSPFRRAKKLEWKLKNTLQRDTISFWKNCYHQVNFTRLFRTGRNIFRRLWRTRVTNQPPKQLEWRQQNFRRHTSRNGFVRNSDQIFCRFKTNGRNNPSILIFPANPFAALRQAPDLTESHLPAHVKIVWWFQNGISNLFSFS